VVIYTVALHFSSEKVQHFRPIGTAEHVVYAIPPVASGAAVWYPMATAMNASVDLRAIRLPGREDRFTEKPIYSVDIQVADILPALRAQVEYENMPYNLAGMCSGATLAFELTAALEAIPDLRGPDSLIVINQLPPTESALMSADFGGSADELSNQDWLLNVAGLPPEMITDEVLKFFGPTIEGDMSALRSYKYSAHIINARIVVVIGTSRNSFPVDGKNGWPAFTKGTCELVRMSSLRPALDADLAALISRVVI